MYCKLSCVFLLLQIFGAVATNTCPDDQEYLTCQTDYPTSCVPQVDDNSDSAGPTCYSGCYCTDSQLVIGPNGICIELFKCPHLCPDDQVFTQCNALCEAVCPNQAPNNCQGDCVPGCVCQEGTLNNTRTGDCGTLDDCENCPIGEHYECGSACPPTCQNTTIANCTLECVEDCFCDEGTIRDAISGICVPLSKCSECGINQNFQKCVSACPPTCSSPDPDCTGSCVNACYCIKGTILSDVNGTCIPQEFCSQCEGKEYQNCGPTTPQTCEDLMLWTYTKTCTEGCYCPQGSILDSTTQECVSPDQCCPTGEIFSFCNGNCQSTCSNQNPLCPLFCGGGCVCPDGQLRNADGTCVTSADCTCPAGEILDCGSTCPPTCLYPNQTCDYSACQQGCYCPNGTIRNDFTSECIAPEDCPSCPAGQEYSFCGGTCQSTCSNPNPQCNEECSAGCVCGNETMLDTNTGECVTLDNCS